MKNALVVALCALSLTGCATVIEDSRKSVVVGVHVLSAATDVVTTVDHAKQAAALKKAQAGDIAGAQADLTEWDKEYSKIAASLSVAWDTLRALADTCSAAENGKVDTATLIKLGTTLVVTLNNLKSDLAAAGISVPGLSISKNPFTVTRPTVVVPTPVSVGGN